MGDEKTQSDEEQELDHIERLPEEVLENLEEPTPVPAPIPEPGPM